MHEAITACKKCGEAKPLADFYARSARCKPCAKSAATANRLARLDYYKAYDRHRANRPDRVELRKRYQQTDAFKNSHAKATTKYRVTHEARRAAQVAVGNALRSGHLQRLPCFVCGAANSEAHHPDYSAPLAVTWLCDMHHKETHKLANALRRKAAAPIGLQYPALLLCC